MSGSLNYLCFSEEISSNDIWKLIKIQTLLERLDLMETREKIRATKIKILEEIL